jgi:hypothetical protein
MILWVRAVPIWAALLVPVDVVEHLAANVDDATSRVEARECIPQAECCWVCSKGKACGNACIAAWKECHKGRGCACNADEICAN